MRLTAYAGTSTVLAVGVILKAFYERPNFYSATVYLSQSNACLMILANFILMSFVGFMYELQRLLYGPLRPIEVEQLYDKSWFAVMETLLAMTVFREEFGTWFLVMLVSLIAAKVWGWIGEGRVEILEQQPPTNPLLFHTRLSISLILSACFDMFMLDYATHTVLEQPRPGMMVMFAFEFAVLTISSTSTAVRYAMFGRERMIIKQQTQVKIEQRKAELRAARQATTGEAAPGGTNTSVEHVPTEDSIDENEIDVPGWEDKGRYMFYLDLLTEFTKLVVYMAFFFILIAFHGLPLHIIRDVYLTMRSFVKRVNDFVKYRNATRNMNARYPDATREELDRESTCIICREEMRPWHQGNNPPVAPEGAAPQPHQSSEERLRPKKLPCGHILHFGCLRSWLERQQMCPTCRQSVLAPSRTTAPPNGQQGQPGAPHPNHLQLPPNLLADPNQEQLAPGQGRRVYSFGPFRLILGGGNAAQRQPLGPQQVQQPAPNGRDRHSTRNTSSAVPGRVRSVLNRTSGEAAAQLLLIENQIMHEINNLNLAQNQLGHVRALQAELNRLRSAQFSNLRPQGAMQMAQVPQVYGPHPQHPQMGPGHASLPPGVTLPEGWTVLPLQQLRQPGNRPPGVSGAAMDLNPIPGMTNHFMAAASQAGGPVPAGGRPGTPVPTMAFGGMPGIHTWQSNTGQVPPNIAFGGMPGIHTWQNNTGQVPPNMAFGGMPGMPTWQNNTGQVPPNMAFGGMPGIHTWQNNTGQLPATTASGGMPGLPTWQNNNLHAPPTTAFGGVHSGNLGVSGSTPGSSGVTANPSPTPAPTAPNQSSSLSAPPPPFTNTQTIHPPTSPSRPLQSPSSSPSMLPDWGVGGSTTSTPAVPNIPGVEVVPEAANKSGVVDPEVLPNGHTQSKISQKDKGKGKAAAVEDVEEDLD